MKRLQSSLIAVILAIASTAALGTAPSSRSSIAQYRVADVQDLSSIQNPSIVGMNSHGDIVANAVVGSRSVIVVELGAGTPHARIVRLRSPLGFHNVAAAGINDAGTVAAQAWNSGGPDAPFVAGFAAGHFTWTRLPTSVTGTGSYVVAGIAVDGDVVGTRQQASASAEPSRAVLWRSRFGGSYAAAMLLPLTKGYSRSEASAIWSSVRRPGRIFRLQREVIVGAEQRGDQPSDRYTAWSPGPNQSPVIQGLPGIIGNAPALALGGWANHVYVSGRVMGVDTGGGWRSTIRFTDIGSALPGPVQPLAYPRYRGAECFYGANAVSAGTDGKFVAVGGVSCIAGAKQHPQALLWRGNAVTELQNRIPTGNGWQLDDAWVINSKGQIVGTGKLNGRSAVYILTPALN